MITKEIKSQDILIFLSTQDLRCGSNYWVSPTDVIEAVVWANGGIWFAKRYRNSSPIDKEYFELVQELRKSTSTKILKKSICGHPEFRYKAQSILKPTDLPG